MKTNKTETADKRMEFITIQNENWKVGLAPDGSKLILEDLSNNTVWSSGEPFHFSYGKFREINLSKCCETVSIRAEEDILRCDFLHFDFWTPKCTQTYRKPERLKRKMSFHFCIHLNGREILFVMEPVEEPDEEESTLTFPAKLFHFSVSDAGEALIPCGFGGLFRFPRNDHFDYRYHYSYDYNAIPVYGLLRKERGGLGVYAKSRVDQETHMAIDTVMPGELLFETKWEIEKHLANQRRELIVRSFAPGENYVTLAKWYRSKVREENRFVSLREKINAFPETEKLIGAVIWKHNVYSGEAVRPVQTDEPYPDRTAKQLFDTAHEAGFDRVCVYNTGWNRYGYDIGYPTRLPPNPDRGTAEEFTAAAEYARNLSPDYIYSVHDNYIDCYTDSPEYNPGDLTRDRNGIPVQGGLWMGGRAELICSGRALNYAKRDIPEIRKMLGRGSIYVDVLGCTAVERCYNPEHIQTREEDLASRRALIDFVRREFGSVATEGAPADYCADLIALGAYSSVNLCIPLDFLGEPPLPVPFWQLVYHDSVLNYTDEATSRLAPGQYPQFQALYNLLPTAFDPYNLNLSKEMRGTFVSEMTSHAFTPDLHAESDRKNRQVLLSGGAKTEFADGTVVRVNFSNVPAEVFGRAVPARGIVIHHPSAGNEFEK